MSKRKMEVLQLGERESEEKKGTKKLCFMVNGEGGSICV